MTLIFDGIAPWIAVDTLVLAGMHITGLYKNRAARAQVECFLPTHSHASSSVLSPTVKPLKPFDIQGLFFQPSWNACYLLTLSPALDTSASH